MAQTTRMERLFADFTETIAAKTRKRLSGLRFAINYTRLQAMGTERLKIIGLPYTKDYELLALHPESLASYAEITTVWTGGELVHKLTPFAIMEHCQLHLTGNSKIPYLNQN